MDWKRKTPDEEDLIVHNGDFTCGYDFLPWLVFKRLWYIIPMFGMLAFGSYVSLNWQTMDEGSPDTFALGTGIFFIAASVLVAFMLVRDYKKGKKGRS